VSEPYELQSRDQQRPAWYLEIDGLPDRIHSLNIAAAQVPANINFDGLLTGIESVGARSATVPPWGGISRERTVQVSLVALPGSTLARHLLRVGYKGSDLRARLLTPAFDVVAGAPAPFFADRDISAWPQPGKVWIGQEAISYTTTTTPVGGPFQFNGPIARGVYQTQVERHQIGDASGNPWITGHPVAWDNRRARLFVAHRRHDGSVADNWFVYASGILQGPPRRDSDGRSIQLAIVPEVQSLRGRIGGEAFETRLANDWHYFERSAGTIISHIQRWGQGQAYAGHAVAPSVAGQLLDIDHSAPAEAHEQVFDVDLPTPNAALAPPGAVHPRVGILLKKAVAGAPRRIRLPTHAAGVPYNVGPPAFFDVTGAVAPFLTTFLFNPVGIGEPVENEACEELVHYNVLVNDPTGWAPVSERLLQWPDEVVAGYNATKWTDAAPQNSTQGVGGQWARTKLVTGADGPGQGVGMGVRLNSQDHYGKLGIIFQAKYLAQLWYGIDMAQPGSDAYYFPVRDMANWTAEQRDQSKWTRSSWTDARMLVDAKKDDLDRPPDFIPFRRFFPRAYYQTGERYMLVEEDVFPAAPFVIRCTFKPELGAYAGTNVDTYAIVINKAQVTDPADGTFTVGTRLEIANDGPANRYSVMPFGAWPGQPEPVISRVMYFALEDPRTLLLKLLLSAAGNGFNDATYDVIDGGLNIPAIDVYIESFLAFPLPGFAPAMDLDVRHELKIETLLQETLEAIGAGIVSKVNPATGRRQLTLVRLGVPVFSAVRLDVTDASAHGDPHSMETSKTLRNQLLVRANFDPRTDKPQLTIDLKNEGSRREHGAWFPLEIELRGIRVEEEDLNTARARFLPRFAELIAEFGHRSRRVHVELHGSDMAMLSPGDVISLTAAQLEDVDGSAGVTDRSIRLDSVSWDAESGRGAVEGRMGHVNASGWAPTMQVTAVVSPTVVDVDAHIATPAIDPTDGTAKTDYQWFLDHVDLFGYPVNVGTWTDVGVPVAILGILVTDIQGPTSGTPGRVTFAAAHGLGVGDWVTTPFRIGSGAYFEKFAHFADGATEQLLSTTGGAHFDPANEYA